MGVKLPFHRINSLDQLGSEKHDKPLGSLYNSNSDLVNYSNINFASEVYVMIRVLGGIWFLNLF